MKVAMETSEVKNEEKKTATHKTTFCSLIWNFCDYTSAHGLGRISGVKHWTRTVFWSLLFIGAVTMLCIQVYTLLNKYESRPLTTLVTVKKETSLNFPMVTFCNYNALKNFSVQGNKNNNLTAFVQAGTNVDNPRVNSTSKPTPESSSTDNFTDEIWRDDNFENPDELDSQFLRGEEMAAYLAREDVQILTLLGHQFDEMVLSCTYRGVSCRNYTTSYWTRFWHYKYGNCFVFNRGEVNGVEVGILKSNNPGPSQGLNLEINIEQDEYIGPLTPEAGIRVDISPQGAMPFPLDKGVSLAPGYATMIGLRKMIKERKDPFQNNRCLETIFRDNNNLYTRLFNVSYSSTVRIVSVSTDVAAKTLKSITPRKYDIIYGTKSTSNKGSSCGGLSEEHESNIAESTSTETAEEGTTLFERQTRISLTLRKIRHIPCNCSFACQCDSQNDKNNPSAVPPSSDVPKTIGEAQNLENIHVHEVYEKIAPHFSGTRHSPWPKIAEFLREQPVGSLVADVGCGNGKYLGINENIFKTGSDRSVNLAAICRERGFSVIVCDILSLPYRSNAFDVCLCIAVLHHLSTAERRLSGLRELVRITRPGGLVLVYVWALEQEAKKVKKKQLKEVDFTGKNDHRTVQDNENTLDESAKQSGVAVVFPGSKEPYKNKSENSRDSNVTKLLVNATRESFEQQDLFVPWKYSGPGKQEKQQNSKETEESDLECKDGHVYHRYYHVFQDGELRELCSHLNHVTVENHYYDKGNWCVVLRKNQ